MNSVFPNADPFEVMLKEASSLMFQMEPEPVHAQQVCFLALRLFDELRSLHGMSPADRALLEASALLHDIGWSISGSRHHKYSARLIEEHSWKGVHPLQVLQIAAIARYHRKAHPKTSHYIFNRLDDDCRSRVQRLAALLRVADGLDRGHQSRVKALHARLNEEHCILLLSGDGVCSEEIWGAQRKKGLFEEVFQRHLELKMEDAQLIEPFDERYP